MLGYFSAAIVGVVENPTQLISGVYWLKIMNLQAWLDRLTFRHSLIQQLSSVALFSVRFPLGF